MRTNIVLNDELVREAMRYSRMKTKTALVEEALRTFVEVKAAAERTQKYETQAEELRRKLRGLRIRESAHALLRQDRDR